MNYPYGYNARFGGFSPQNPGAGAFYGPGGQMTPPMPQNAPQAPQTAFPAPGAFSVQPVSSREEALAVIADPMSAGVLLPDLGHGVVYVKKFNPNTGASDFGEFRLIPAAPVENPVETPEFVTRKDFEEALTQLRAELTPKGRRKEAAADE